MINKSNQTAVITVWIYVDARYKVGDENHRPRAAH
jgi:hypothetical protein